MNDTNHTYSASDQEWLQKGASDVSLSEKNIEWVDKLFKSTDNPYKFIDSKEDFYLVGFVVALAHDKKPEFWKGRKGKDRFISKIVRGWDAGRGDQARTLLRKVFGTKILENGMNPDIGANKCISSLVDQGLTIIHEKHLMDAGDTTMTYTWFGISMLLAAPKLWGKTI